ncbi:MAG: T9SS type A sorting domain-containing protein [Flavipsychrobacter sp.]
MYNKLRSIGLLIGLLTISCVSRAQYVFEKYDLEPNRFEHSNPGLLLPTDSFLYFLADVNNTGFEPWKSDGTYAGTKMITEIIPGKTSTTGTNLGTINGKVIFIANDLTHGAEPWITDGTANGTYMLKDVFTGPPPSLNTNRPSSAAIGGLLYFTPDDGPHGQELWVTDGTTNGTRMIKDIRPGIKSSQPSQFIEYNNKIYFTAFDDTNGSELWVTDGTSNGTKLVIDGSQGGSSSYINHLTVYNNKLYYTGYLNAVFGLIESNGTAIGTKLVAEVGVGVTPSKESSIVLFNGKMYFGGSDTTSPTKGIELWETDGTANGTRLVLDINPFFGQSSYPRLFTVVGNQLFFVADDAVHQEELWVTDGTTNGTKMVKDISKHPVTGSQPRGLIAYKNKLVFVAADTTASGRGIWISDGTANGTIKIKGYDYVTKFNPTSALTLYKGSIYFPARDTSYLELWKLTDTTTSTPPPNAVAALKNTPSKIIIAPNPAHDRVYITLDKAYSNAQLTITDITGRSILKQSITNTQTQIEVALPNLPTGTYLLNVHHKDGVLSQRLLIE